MQDSKIEWTTHTFNPWRGCTKVSPGCQHCYAEAQSGRNHAVLGVWGPEGTRVVAAEAQWRQLPRWNAAAEAAGERHRVFCASLADVFEGRDTMPAASHDAIDRARLRLMGAIEQTDNLDWLLLTKRPHNVRAILPRLAILNGLANPVLRQWSQDIPPANVWLGASVEDQRRAEERIPALLATPARVRFLSCEPLLGPLDLAPWLRTGNLHWVIVGGESGHHARPFHLDWADEIVGACMAAKVPVFVKQLGQSPVMDRQPLKLIDRKKGGDMSEFPVNLQVREFPIPR